MQRNGVLSTVTESNELDSLDTIPAESMSLLVEAMILENANSEEIIELCESADIVNDLIEMGAVEESTIVRLNKQARTDQLEKIAIFTIAKERNDPDFRKLLTVWNMERNLEEKLKRKYGAEAGRRAKKTVQRDYRQRGNVFAKVATRASAKGPGAKASTRKSQVVKGARR